MISPVIIHWLIICLSWNDWHIILSPFYPILFVGVVINGMITWWCFLFCYLWYGSVWSTVILSSSGIGDLVVSVSSFRFETVSPVVFGQCCVELSHCSHLCASLRRYVRFRTSERSVILLCLKVMCVRPLGSLMACVGPLNIKSAGYSSASCVGPLNAWWTFITHLISALYLWSAGFGFSPHCIYEVPLLSLLSCWSLVLGPTVLLFLSCSLVSSDQD